MKLFTTITFALIACAVRADVPATIVLNGRYLEQNRKASQQPDSPQHKQLALLLRDADKALKEGPFAVTDKTRLPPSGDRHDYASLGPYWWPDPNKPDGLPWIRKDGEKNPAVYTSSSDAHRKNDMTSAVHKLALGYYFTGKNDYAEHAAKLLSTWFLDPKTRMNPNLNFGQAIPGRTDGRCYGIIETRGFPDVIDAAILIEPSEAWTKADHNALKKWFTDYLKWLQTSTIGIAESKTRNNHATWYDAQVAGYALFTGQRELAKTVVEAAGERLLRKHIEADGRQPHELRRTKSMSYSCFNLQGLMTLARIGESLDVDLWHFPADEKPLIRVALDYLLPFLDKNKPWPHQQIKPFNHNGLRRLLRQAAAAYSDSEYQQLLEADEHIDSSVLFYP